MDTKFVDLFDNHNAEDERYGQIIPTLNTYILREVLEKDIEIINKSEISVGDWVKFKYELMKCEFEWQVQVFKWIPNKKDKYSYGIDINWNSLENKSTRYFHVHMAFENIWMSKSSLANVWEAIDKQ